VVFVQANQAGQWRLGLAVSRKLGGAVRRNRIKRLVREFFRLHGPEMTLPLDVVVVPKRHVDARSLDLDVVAADLGPLLARIRRDFGRPPRETEAEGKQ
jgi:ribonuclease P protein component